MPRPHAINFTGLYGCIAGHAVDSACSNRLPSLKFVGDTLSVSSLIGLVTLTIDLLTFKLTLSSQVFRVMGFHSVDFKLPMALHTILELGRGTRQTDGQTD